jgi:hypothetical protein
MIAGSARGVRLFLILEYLRSLREIADVNEMRRITSAKARKAITNVSLRLARSSSIIRMLIVTGKAASAATFFVEPGSLSRWIRLVILLPCHITLSVQRESY